MELSREENGENIVEDSDIKKIEKPPNFQKNGYLDILIEKIIH